MVGKITIGKKLLQRRKTLSGERFILDLHASDLFNNFTRMSSADFEYQPTSVYITHNI
jgi:hypothetical protein